MQWSHDHVHTFSNQQISVDGIPSTEFYWLIQNPDITPQVPVMSGIGTNVYKCKCHKSIMLLFLIRNIFYNALSELLYFEMFSNNWCKYSRKHSVAPSRRLAPSHRFIEYE